MALFWGRRTGSLSSSFAAPFRLEVFLGGVQKAGTTTLFRYLQAHPQLVAPSRKWLPRAIKQTHFFDIKETHFFDDETLDWNKPDYGALKAFFPATAADRLAFDATPIYLFWPPSLARIHAHNPDARLIFVFRDPIERAWSHWRMEKGRRAEHLPFAAAIREGRQRLRDIPPLDQAWRVYSYVERGFYAHQVRRLLNLFPRDRILLLSLRDLERNRQAVLQSIASFLSITPFPPLRARHEHRSSVYGVSPRMQKEDIVYLRSVFREEVEEFSKLSGLRVDDWLTMCED